MPFYIMYYAILTYVLCHLLDLNLEPNDPMSGAQTTPPPYTLLFSRAQLFKANDIVC